MSLPQLDQSPSEPRSDLGPQNSPATENSSPQPDAAEPELPARVNAEHAINEFRSKIFDMTYDQAREAYMRLIVGRGFSKSKRLPMVKASGSTAPAPTNSAPAKIESADSFDKPSLTQEEP